MGFNIVPEDEYKYISERISEEDLWLRYFKVDFKKLFKSPLRLDHHETCSMYKSSRGRWMMKDHNGSFTGSIWDALMVDRNLTYRETLSLVLQDFRGQLEYLKPLEINHVPDVKKKVEIRIKPRTWLPYDLAYWDQYGIRMNVLDRFNVIPTDMVWMSNKSNGELELKLISNPLNPIYAYRFGFMEYKIYLPLATEFRWLCNTSAIQGLKQLPKTGDLLILSKSLKDIMTLYSMGYNAIAVQGEGQHFPKDLMQNLKGRFKRIVVLYDNDFGRKDNVGRRCGKKIADEYEIQQIEIPTEYQIKDPSDMVKALGMEKAKLIIKSLLQ